MKQRHARRRRHAPIDPVEALEQRLLLANITWANRDTTDNFSAYGASEDVARAIVDRAIADWEAVIEDFNYAGPQTGFTLNVTADPGFPGLTTNVEVDDDGKPYSADIFLDDANPGNQPWFFDPVIADGALPDDGEFAFDDGELLTPFAARTSGAGLDFYTVVAHEIGHALGISSGGGLAIDAFLSPAVAPDPVNPSQPGDPGNNVYAFNPDGGVVEATFTDAGSDADSLFPNHIYEGPPVPGFPGLPTHPFDLLADGRSIDVNQRERRLISDTDATILGLAYGYDVNLPSQINTFFANLNTTSHDLRIRAVEGNFDDTIRVRRSGTDLVVEVNDTAERFPVSEVDSIVIFAGDGDDQIFVDDLPANMPLTLVSEISDTGDDVVRIGDGDIDSNILSSVSGGTGGGMDTLYLDDQDDAGADAYTFTTINFAKGSANVSLSSPEHIVLNANASANTINLAADFFPPSLTINAGGGADTLNVTDANNPNNLPRTYSLLNSVITLPSSTVTFSSVSTLNFDAGAGNDTFHIDAKLGTYALNIDANGGDDVVHAGDGDIDSDLFGDTDVDGGGGADTLLLDDQFDAVGNDTYTLAANSFSKSSLLGTLTFSAINALRLDANNLDNTINVNSTASATAVTVNGAGGDDAVLVGNGDIDSNIRNDLTVIGGFGADDLVLLDASDAGNDTYNLGADTFTKTAYQGQLGYTFFQTVRLEAGGQANTVNVNAAGADAAVTVNGNGGNDAFNLGAGDFDTNFLNAVSVNGGAGTDSLFLDDTLDAGDDAYSLNSTSFNKTGLAAAVSFSGLNSLRLGANGGNNAIALNGSFVGAYTIQGNHGADLIAANSVALFAPAAVIDGGPGLDDVIANTRIQFNNPQDLASLTINTAGRARTAPSGTNTLNTRALAIGGAGRLDLTDNTLEIDYALTGVTPAATIRSYLATGYNGGAWNGPGINSSLVAAPAQSVGYLDLDDLDRVIVRRALVGDLNLDGTVTAKEKARVNINVGMANATWADGDADYDDTVSQAEADQAKDNWK